MEQKEDNAHLNVLKVIHNEGNILTQHEIIDPIAEQIVSLTTQLCKESKLWIHANLWKASLSSVSFASQIYGP